MRNDDHLFYTCSLIEFIARETCNRRCDVVSRLGDDLQRIYNYADVFHCEPIEKVAYDFIERDAIENGRFDNIAACHYTVPDYWDIGEVFARLVEDCYGEDEVVEGIREVYASWFAEHILNFNSDLFYQPREYLALCYREGEILE